MLTVHGRKTSVNVQKVMWAVGELGLAHTRTDVGGPFGGLDTAAFGAMNPNRLVPVIDDNGFRLWESNAIVRYLAETYGRGGVAPEGRYAFAKADQWAEWGQSTLYGDIITTCFLQLIRTPAKDRNTALVNAAAERAGGKLGLIEAELQGKAFIAGDTLTIADIGIGSMMYRYINLPLKRPRLPNVEGWIKRLEERQAYREHVMVDFAAMKVPGA
jgi:glutathione S-transferase